MIQSKLFQKILLIKFASQNFSVENGYYSPKRTLYKGINNTLLTTVEEKTKIGKSSALDLLGL